MLVRVVRGLGTGGGGGGGVGKPAARRLVRVVLTLGGGGVAGVGLGGSGSFLAAQYWETSSGAFMSLAGIQLVSSTGHPFQVTRYCSCLRKCRWSMISSIS